MRRLIMAGAAMLIAGTLAACGSGTSGSSGSSGGGPSGTLTLDDETGSQWNCSFNPFNPTNTGNGITSEVY